MRYGERPRTPPRGKGDDLDFEIGFYRAIVAQAPAYVDALMLLGEACPEKGLYAEGLELSFIPI